MNCGRSSSVEWKLPKLQRRVRFPSPAPIGRSSGYQESGWAFFLLSLVFHGLWGCRAWWIEGHCWGFGAVSGTSANRASKSVGHRQKVSVVTDLAQCKEESKSRSNGQRGRDTDARKPGLTQGRCHGRIPTAASSPGKRASMSASRRLTNRFLP